jgi:hypothetical protein
MRVNIYAEEMTDRVEIVSKTIDGIEYTGLRIYLELPVSEFKFAQGTRVTKETSAARFNDPNGVRQVKGAFIHRPGDDDSSAITFWGKADLLVLCELMQNKLIEHYRNRRRNQQPV